MTKPMLTCCALGALALATAPAFSQERDFEVTLQVLDDVSDIDAVLLVLREEPDEVEGRESDERDEERERHGPEAGTDLERALERGREIEDREDRDVEREREAAVRERELEEQAPANAEDD